VPRHILESKGKNLDRIILKIKHENLRNGILRSIEKTNFTFPKQTTIEVIN